MRYNADVLSMYLNMLTPCLDGLMVSVSASHAVGRGFAIGVNPSGMTGNLLVREPHSRSVKYPGNLSAQVRPCTKIYFSCRCFAEEYAIGGATGQCLCRGGVLLEYIRSPSKSLDSSVGRFGGVVFALVVWEIKTLLV